MPDSGPTLPLVTALASHCIWLRTRLRGQHMLIRSFAYETSPSSLSAVMYDARLGPLVFVSSRCEQKLTCRGSGGGCWIGCVRV